MEAKHLFLVIFVMICFGSVYPLGKLGTNNIPPILFSSLRVLIILIGILPFFKIKLPSKKLILPLLTFSLTMGIGVYVTLYFALDITSLLSPIIIGTQLTVPFGLILSFIFLNEKISLKKCLLIFFAFVGIVIVAYDPRIRDEWIALLIISLMAFFYALANILSRYLKNINTVDQIGWHSFIGFIILIFASILIDGNPFNYLYPINYGGLLTAFHAGVFVTLIGHGGLFYLYKYYPVATVLPFYSLFPLFGIALTLIIFLEIPGLYEIIGGIIVIGSVYLIQLQDKHLRL